MDFAQALRASMDERGMSGNALAHRVHCDKALISRFVNGKQAPSAKLARLIDEALGAGGELAELTAPPHPLGAAPDGTFTPDDEDRLLAAARSPSRIGTATVESLAVILAAQRNLEDQVGSAAVREPVRAQIAAVGNLVTGARGTIRPALTDVAAQWAEFAGWLAISTGQPAEARRMYDRAAEWAAEAGNTTMAATILSFRGHLAFLLGQFGATIGLSRAAQRDPAIWAGQRAYDAHQEARGLAVTGERNAAVRKLGEAAGLVALTEEQGGQPPPWIYYYTPSFYALERGWAYLYLSRRDPAANDQAIRYLTEGLAGLDEGTRRSEWAAEHRRHLVNAYAQAGAPDRAAAEAMEVVRVARSAGSASLLGAVRRQHARLAARWPDDPDVALLGEALR
ncbi:MAG TPA: helix-turn-helix transcriptional regulator [Streptosporangiaceae bacterium]